MPSKSPQQAKLMEAIAHGWKPSHKKDVPSKEVAQEFVNADKRKKEAASKTNHDGIGMPAVPGTGTVNPEIRNQGKWATSKNGKDGLFENGSGKLGDWRAAFPGSTENR